MTLLVSRLRRLSGNKNTFEEGTPIYKDLTL